MKNFLCYLYFFIFILSTLNNRIYGQSNCTVGTATETFFGGNAKIRLSSSGIWSGSEEGGPSAYQWPASENSQGVLPGLIAAGNFWMGGLDDGHNLKLSGQTYEQDGMVGYWPGPLSEDGTTTSESCTNWDRFFKIDNTEIESYRDDFEDNNQLDDPIPLNILGWPGNGNTSFNDVHGFDMPDNIDIGFAPFIDQNGKSKRNLPGGSYLFGSAANFWGESSKTGVGPIRG